MANRSDKRGDTVMLLVECFGGKGRFGQSDEGSSPVFCARTAPPRASFSLMALSHNLRGPVLVVPESGGKPLADWSMGHTGAHRFVLVSQSRPCACPKTSRTGRSVQKMPVVDIVGAWEAVAWEGRRQSQELPPMRTKTSGLVDAAFDPGMTAPVERARVTASSHSLAPEVSALELGLLGFCAAGRDDIYRIHCSNCSLHPWTCEPFGKIGYISVSADI